MLNYIANDSNESHLYRLLTSGLLKTEKVQNHSFFMEPDLEFVKEYNKVINYSYMCHSGILCGDSTATIVFDLPWFMCINFLHPVGSSTNYREADSKLKKM